MLALTAASCVAKNAAAPISGASLISQSSRYHSCSEEHASCRKTTLSFAFLANLRLECFSAELILAQASALSGEGGLSVLREARDEDIHEYFVALGLRRAALPMLALTPRIDRAAETSSASITAADCGSRR